MAGSGFGRSLGIKPPTWHVYAIAARHHHHSGHKTEAKRVAVAKGGYLRRARRSGAVRRMTALSPNLPLPGTGVNHLQSSHNFTKIDHYCFEEFSLEQQ